LEQFSRVINKFSHPDHASGDLTSFGTILARAAQTFGLSKSSLACVWIQDIAVHDAVVVIRDKCVRGLENGKEERVPRRRSRDCEV
jgi:hypothetical protein